MMDQLFPTEDHSFIDIFDGLTPAGLALLRDAVCPALSDADMAACRAYFCEKEHRAPTVGELRFLSALCRYLQTMPEAAVLTSLTFSDAESARVWQDICRMRQTLSPNAPYPPTLREVAGICGRYLARAGRCGNVKAPVCDEAAALAAACCGHTPQLVVELPTLSGAVLPDVKFKKGAWDLLLLLHPTGKEPFAAEIARFFAENALEGAYPLALVREEGLLHALVEANAGATVDLAALPDGEEAGAARLLTAARHTLLVAAPEAALARVEQGELPLTLIGRGRPDGRLVVQENGTTHLTMHLSFLAARYTCRNMALTVPTVTAFSAITPKTVRKNGKIVAGVSTEGRALPALIDLVRAAVTEGADLHGAVLTATLILPDAEEASMTAALPLLLDLHRFTAELALPAEGHRVLQKKDASPTLSILLSAPAGPVPAPFLQNRMQSAIKSGDFEALRRAIYEKL